MGSETSIGNALSRERIRRLLSHQGTTIILAGPRHTGKHEFIREITSSLDERDIISVGPTVDEARQVVEFLSSFAVYSAIKVAIVDCGELFSESAQDAYLKICEELEDSVLIFIAEDENHVQSTLLSRLDVIRWNALTHDEMKIFASENGLEVDDNVVKICKGRPFLYSTLSKLEWKNLFKIMSAIIEGRVDPLIAGLPPLVKQIESGTSIEKDALAATCEAASAVAAEAELSINFLKFASVLHRFPHVGVEMHWWRACLRPAM